MRFRRKAETNDAKLATPLLVFFKGVSQGGKSKSPLGRIFGDFLCDQKVT